ncbi:MAG: hypothetical protein O7F76_03720 [Planctomycetota bacterium]|nr:hypothetical protein [Planctomycetota bacterium]
MSEEPFSSEARDVIRADELEAQTKPSRFGRRLVALTFVGLVTIYVISERPWESKSLDDPVMSEEQANYVREARDYVVWFEKNRSRLPNPFDETVLTREAKYSGERRIEGWIGMVLQYYETDGRKFCSATSGWVFNLLPDQDNPYEIPKKGDWVRFDGTLSHRFTRNPKDYMYTYVAVKNLKVIRAGTFKPLTNEAREKIRSEQEDIARRLLLPPSPGRNQSQREQDNRRRQDQ